MDALKSTSGFPKFVHHESANYYFSGGNKNDEVSPITLRYFVVCHEFS